MIDPAAYTGLPRGDADEPVFRAPWEAHAFALAVQLHQRGLFTGPSGPTLCRSRFAKRSPQAKPTPATATTATGWPHWRHWSPARARAPAASLPVMPRLGTTLRARPRSPD